MHEGINDFCPKCQAVNKEYGMYKVIYTGDYDTRSTTLVFNHVDIRKVVRYCWKNNISLHDEDYNINSPYDCTVNVPQNITELDIENIIVSSFEGGSNNWMMLDNSTLEFKNKPKNEPLATWTTKLLIDGKKIIIMDMENENKEYILTQEQEQLNF